MFDTERFGDRENELNRITLTYTEKSFHCDGVTEPLKHFKISVKDSLIQKDQSLQHVSLGALDV